MAIFVKIDGFAAPMPPMSNRIANQAPQNVSNGIANQNPQNLKPADVPITPRRDMSDSYDFGSDAIAASMADKAPAIGEKHGLEGDPDRP